MICAHCKARDVVIDHVKACARSEQAGRDRRARELLPEVEFKTTTHADSVQAHIYTETEAAAARTRHLHETGVFQGKPAPTLAAMLKRPSPSTIEGVYFKDEFYYKVQQSPNTGHHYAKVWESPLGNGHFEWTYQGRKPLHNLTLAHKATPEQAARFGKVNGACVFCSRKLTDERSIEVGYGPVCAEHNGLPWG